MLHLGLRKPRANDLEMQVVENTADLSFHNAFPPALPRSLPASGHSIPQLRISLGRKGCGRTAAPPHLRREDPQGDSDFLQATRNPAACLRRPGRPETRSPGVSAMGRRCPSAVSATECG